MLYVLCHNVSCVEFSDWNYVPSKAGLGDMHFVKQDSWNFRGRFVSLLPTTPHHTKTEHPHWKIKQSTFSSIPNTRTSHSSRGVYITLAHAMPSELPCLQNPED